MNGGDLPLKNNKNILTKRAFAKALAAGPRGKYFLRLYVAGATARSRQALRRVAEHCEAELKGNYVLEVIDIYQEPALTQKHQIVATPTLIKELPLPVRRFVGSLLNLAALVADTGPALPGEMIP